MTTTAQTNWVIDPTHSEIQFKVKHLVISTVTGSFTKFNATAKTSGDSFEGAEVFFEADTDSITTGMEQRDGHLKSPDFFDAATHPKMTFKSSAMRKLDEENYELEGDLTIRGTSKPVKLKAQYGGTMVDFYGQTKAGFEISGSIKRKEFGLSWDGVTEAGGIVVSDEVRLHANIQMTKQA